MKRYTKKVEAGLRIVRSVVSEYATDKYDEGERQEADEIQAALDWIAYQERRLRRAAVKRGEKGGE